MLDFKKEVVASLNEILPTYYELFVDSKTPLPCITYRVIGNNTTVNTNEAGVSNITCTVKV